MQSSGETEGNKILSQHLQEKQIHFNTLWPFCDRGILKFSLGRETLKKLA